MVTGSSSIVSRLYYSSLSFNIAYFDLTYQSKSRDLPIETLTLHELGIISAAGANDLIIKTSSPLLISLVNEVTNAKDDRIKEIVILMQIHVDISPEDEEGLEDEVHKLNRLADANLAKVIAVLADVNLVGAFVVRYNLTGNADQVVGMAPPVLEGGRIPSIDAVGKVLLRRLVVEISHLDLEDEHPIVLVDESVVESVVLVELVVGLGVLLVSKEVVTFAVSAFGVGAVVLRSTSAVFLDTKSLNHCDCG